MLPLSRHAQARRKAMKVTEDEIRRALTEPDLVYPGHSGRMMHQRGRIVVVTCRWEVVTVLWHLSTDRESGPARCDNAVKTID